MGRSPACFTPPLLPAVFSAFYPVTKSFWMGLAQRMGLNSTGGSYSTSISLFHVGPNLSAREGEKGFGVTLGKKHTCIAGLTASRGLIHLEQRALATRLHTLQTPAAPDLDGAKVCVSLQCLPPFPPHPLFPVCLLSRGQCLCAQTPFSSSIQIPRPVWLHHTTPQARGPKCASPVSDASVLSTRLASKTQMKTFVHWNSEQSDELGIALSLQSAFPSIYRQRRLNIPWI